MDATSIWFGGTTNLATNKEKKLREKIILNFYNLEEFSTICCIIGFIYT